MYEEEAQLEMTGSAGYVVPAGSSFFTEDNLYYTLQQDTEIPESGKALATVYASEVGEVYNTSPDTILHIASCDTRLEKINNHQPALGGADPESDASLYARVTAYRQRPATSGNEAHYEQWATDVSGVGIARARGLWDGPGTVKVLIADQNSQPVDDAIVESCAAHIALKRPVGPEVTVRSACRFTVDIAANIRLKSGADPDIVCQDFKDSLSAYFRAISLIRHTVLYNRVGSLLISTDGVVDYSGLTINGQAGNLAIGDEDVPAVGEVLFEWI